MNIFEESMVLIYGQWTVLHAIHMTSLLFGRRNFGPVLLIQSVGLILACFEWDDIYSCS